MRTITRLAALAAPVLAALALSAAPALASPHPNLTGRSVATLGAPNVYSSYKSGYVFHGGGWRFRKICENFNTPLTNTRNGTSAWRVYAQLSTGGHQFDSGIMATAADTYQAEYRIDGAITVMTITPVIQPGDALTACVFRDVNGDQALDFSVVDHTTSGAVVIPDVAVPAGAGPDLYASVLAHPNYPAGCGGVNPIATDCLNSQLVQFGGISVTTYNGTTGNLTHKFSASVANVVQTGDGTADGDLYSSPNPPFALGSGGSVWMRP